MTCHNWIDILCGMTTTSSPLTHASPRRASSLEAVRTLGICFSKFRMYIHLYCLLSPCCTLELTAEVWSEVQTWDLSLGQILIRLSKLCVQESTSVRKSRKQQQRLLRNMGAHAVVLELLQIPYEKVSQSPSPEGGGSPRFPQPFMLGGVGEDMKLM